MVKKFSIFLFSLLIAFVFISNMNCQETLKDAFKDHYLIGTAISQYQIEMNDKPVIQLIKQQFNSITPENMLKWEKVHPEPDEYNFEPVDSLIAFGERNNMHIVGHTLVWHSQTPDWVFENEEGEPLSREELLARMKEHIHKVVGRYKGKIDGWDVVNEAFNDDGSYRETKWKNIIGEDYIEKAFEYAFEADPETELYYNDYNMWPAGKVKSVVKLVNELKQKGIKIDGIGLQGHWGTDYPENDELEAAFEEYAKLPVNIMITELDMRVLPTPDDNTGAEISKNYELQEKYNPYKDGFPDSMHTLQSERYSYFFKLFNKYKDKITRVTFWGPNDGYSWKNNWPIRGRTSYPLLFDRENNPKPAFDAVIKTVKQ